MLELPYGTWESPITAAMTARTEKSNRNCDIVAYHEKLYWTEPRPEEKGRTVLLCRTREGQILTITPPGYDVRSKVHEYGGRSFAIHGELIYFINAKDQRLYVQDTTLVPLPLTHEGPRFVELVPSEHGLLAVAEEHRKDKVHNFLALINIKTGSYSTLDEGHDFYAAPTLSSDGKKLAWLTWDHPNMPWDSTQLWVADFRQGTLSNKKIVVGSTNESIFQPQWSPKGELYFISDRSGWWNLYHLTHNTIEAVYPLSAEFGLPLWRLGVSTWCFTGRGEEILCTYQEQGIGKLTLLDPLSKRVAPIPLPFSDYAQLNRGLGGAVLIMGSSQSPRRLHRLDLNSFAIEALDATPPTTVDAGYFSVPEPLAFPSAKGRTAYGYYYAPKNKDYRAKPDTLPPLLVMSHGGPTAAADPIFNLKIQYWTSRGFAVLDVNYGGSTGYGREYRNLLKGQWGIVDVEDCSHGALYLAKKGKVDPEKLAIRGGSAGGYTTLAALAFTKTFSAGASYFGVADLELLATDTHKFEMLYLDQLIGPYPACKKLYEERAPLSHADSISCPVIFFQGAKDRIVPLNQAEKMYEALKSKGIKTKLIIYADEEHGFRQAENIQDSLEQELRFYLKAFGV